MPLYDYSCRGCGHTFEALVRGDTTSLRCGKCQSADIERQVSLFAVNTPGTRQASLNKARKVNYGIEKDKAIAHEEYVNKQHD